MKKLISILIMIFITGMLIGCASPGSLRKDGPALVYATAKGTPQEFGRCLVSQLDEKLYLNTHMLRNNPDGGVTILTYAGGQELRMMFDINKAVNGSNILVYFSWSNNKEKCRTNAIFPLINTSLNACGAQEKI